MRSRDEYSSPKLTSYGKLLLYSISIILGLIAASAVFQLYYLTKNTLNISESHQEIDLSNKSEDLIKYSDFTKTTNSDTKLKEEILNNINNLKVADYEALNSRLASIEAKQNELLNTLLMKPGDSISLKLVIDNQRNLEENLKRVIEYQNKLNEKYDALIINVLAIPLVVVCLGFLSSIIYFFFRKRDNTYAKKGIKKK